MSQFKVLIVDDSPFMRRVFSDVIDSDAAFEVLATASNGIEAVELAFKLRPDIITMDLEMPQMNGLDALKQIMAKLPIPIIMLSAISDSSTKNTIKALQYGALDFIRKPDGAHQLDINKVGIQLLDKLHIALETMNGGSFRMMPAVEEKTDPPDPPHPPPKELEVKASSQIVKDINIIRSSLKQSSKMKTLDSPSEPVQSQASVKRNITSDLSQFSTEPSPPSMARTKPVSKTRQTTEKTSIKETKIASAPTKEWLPSKRIFKGPGIEEEKRNRSNEDMKRNQRSTSFTHLVAIGTSTGGPRALHEVLTGIPADFPAPILVVQHMPPKFTKSLAQRLDNFCKIHIREAEDGEAVESATAYIAPGGYHMSLSKDKKGKYFIRLSQEGPRSGHMPSVDVLFESLLGEQQLKRHIVLMTGMGSDGARSMKALQTDGAATTIAESEQSCVVYGMPRSAVELGAVSHILPLQHIASKIIQEVMVHN